MPEEILDDFCFQTKFGRDHLLNPIYKCERLSTAGICDSFWEHLSMSSFQSLITFADTAARKLTRMREASMTKSRVSQK